MGQKEMVELMKNQIGAVAEMALIFFRATIAAGATMEEALKLTQASAFDRTMKLEAELNRIHGRIIKLLDSIKGYELESRRVRLEERKYNLAKQKLSGAFDIDPETGEINDEQDDFDAELEV